MTWVSDVLIIAGFTAFVVVGIFIILKWTKNKTRRASTLRIYIQAIAVVYIFMGLILGPFYATGTQSGTAPLGITPRDRLVGGFGNQFPDGLSVPILACYYPNGRTVTCPIWQLQAYIFPFWNSGVRGYFVQYATSGYTTSGLEKLGIVLGLVVVMSLVLGRFFCGWLCPFGLYMDLLIRIRKFTRKRHLSFSEKTNLMLRQSRYLIIAVFVVLSVIFGSQLIFGTQLIPGTTPGGPLGTEAGIVGSINEPFCLVCPMRPLCVLAECAVGAMKSSYVFDITSGPFYIVGFYVSSINIAVLILITVLALAYRRFWCRICPLGGLTALFSTFTPFKQVAIVRLNKDEEKCTKCGVCKRVCPTQVTEIYDQKGGDVTVSSCMLCFRCVEMCPYKETLRVKVGGKTVFKSRNWLEPSGTSKNTGRKPMLAFGQKTVVGGTLQSTEIIPSSVAEGVTAESGIESSEVLKEPKEMSAEEETVLDQKQLRKCLAQSINVIDGLFDLIIGLNGQIDWKQMENRLRDSEVSIDKLLSEGFFTADFDVRQLSLAIQNHKTDEISKIAFGGLKSLYDYYGGLSSENAFLAQTHPNYEDAKLVIRSYYTLNDVILGKIVGSEKIAEEINQFLAMFDNLSKQTGLTMNFEAMKEAVGKLQAENGGESITKECRSVFKQNLKFLIRG